MVARNSPFFTIGKRHIGKDFLPLVVAEIGINHNGSLKKAKQMITDAKKAGAECVKFQCHVVEDEMIPIAKKIIPGHTEESIWDIMKRAAFSERQERELKKMVEKMDMIYLSTPFSRAAANRLNAMGVKAFKIGSGECNNYPLVEHIAKFGKPVILSTGMNNIDSVRPSVKIFRKYKIPFALLHCTSMYPTPYKSVRMKAIKLLNRSFPDAVVGLSDHSLKNYTCLAAVALEASILEKHFTSNKKWKGPDISLSINPEELKDLIVGTKAIYQALGGGKTILKEEQDCINFAYASVVTIRDIEKGEQFNKDNLWVKRPGTGEIKAEEYSKILGLSAANNIRKNSQLKYKHIKNYQSGGPNL